MPRKNPVAMATMHDEIQTLKQRHILKEASALFVERGFVGTTMEAIAERLDMSKPFIYQFFSNKHALLIALYDQELRDSLSALGDVAAERGAPTDRLARFIEIAVRKNVANRALTAMLALEEKHLPAAKMAEIHALENQFNHRLTEIVKAGVKAGSFEAPNPAVASRAIMGMLQWVKRWYRPTGALGVDQLASQFQALALKMLAPTRPDS